MGDESLISNGDLRHKCLAPRSNGGNVDAAGVDPIAYRTEEARQRSPEEQVRPICYLRRFLRRLRTGLGVSNTTQDTSSTTLLTLVTFCSVSFHGTVTFCEAKDEARRG
jgi:hypothetical protein